MNIEYGNLSIDSPSGPTLAERLLSIEADLRIVDRDKEIFSESLFPVAELAYWLIGWLNEVDDNEFVFDSMSADPGLLGFIKCESGWIVTSRLAPGLSTRPVSRDALEGEVKSFVARVRMDVSHQGVDPRFLPEVI
ncbi:DUF7878 domain-containing protein [Streptomyces sp. NPDC002666]